MPETERMPRRSLAGSGEQAAIADRLGMAIFKEDFSGKFSGQRK
jgi:hypothetical protein